MLKSTRRNEWLSAFVLIAPFLVIYLVLFVYPTVKMLELSFTNAPLIGQGEWVGFKNYIRLASDRLFKTSVWNTGYFVVLTVVPNVAIGLVIALMVSR